MISFKDFLLFEDIMAKGDELLAAVNDDNSRRPSTPTSISTNKRPLGKQTGTTRGQEVYYAFSYKPSDEPGGSTELLKSFKGKGPFKFPEARTDKFLEDATLHMASELKKMKLIPDVIVTPQSSSALTADFANMLADKLGVEARKINAFKKHTRTKISEDRLASKAEVIKNHIDMDYFNEKYTGDEATKKKELNNLVNSILKSIKENGHIVAKDLYKPMAKFVKNIMDSNLEGDDEYSLMEKNVMVVDDVLSAGATMTDLFRACKDLLADKVFGVTLFARTSA